jgi:4-hydroxy-tetrahydrodipicolinate reductase
MSVRVAIAGAGGRMGRALLEAVAAAEGVTLAAAFDVRGSPWQGRDAAELGAATRGQRALRSEGGARGSGRARRFHAPRGHARACACLPRAKRAMVIGTTGFDAAQLGDIRDAARDIAIVMAPNMSIGVNVAMKLVEMASRSLGTDYDVEVFEVAPQAQGGCPVRHRAQARRSRGEGARRRASRATASSTRHGVTGERKAGAIGFLGRARRRHGGRSHRLLRRPGERIEITHRASSRATYAQGAMRAARFLHGKPPGLYDMQDVLGLK